MTTPADCYSCAHEAEFDRLPPRERIATDEFWRVSHAFNSALPGWLILQPRRHVTSIAELTDAEGFAHVHFHIVPRPADLPADWRGPRIFAQALGPADRPAIGEQRMDEIAIGLARELRAGGSCSPKQPDGSGGP